MKEEIEDMMRENYASVIPIPNITDMNKRLYHYTSNQALYNITKNITFWVSKSDYLNDTSELVYIAEVIEKVCNQFMNQDSSEDEFFKRNLISRATEGLSMLQDIYVLSLTENPDSLTLWSSYSDFVGSNIGLNAMGLYRCLEETGYSCNLRKVIYDREMQEKIIFETIKPVYDYLKNTGGIQGGSPFSEAMQGVYSSILEHSIFFKRPSFYPEEEYRLAFIFDKHCPLSEGNLKRPQEQFRAEKIQ